jgi:hypothetical protein
MQRGAASYQLDELLGFHDRAFIEQVYLALARRAPDEAEATRTLDELRSGRQSKIEIIERLLTAQPPDRAPVRVIGLPSPMMRRVGRWPLVGYLLRLLRGFARLPVLMQHQQQFEVYALAQQQRIADYLNDVLAPAIKQDDGAADAALAAIVADAVESVMMLSDSLIELSARQADMQTQFAQAQAQHERAEAQLHADLSSLTDALTAQQQQLDEVRRAQAASAAAQQEFLVQEQRVIVETQKVALGALEASLCELRAQQAAQRAELAAQVAALRALSAREPADNEPGARVDEEA